MCNEIRNINNNNADLHYCVSTDSDNYGPGG